MAFALRKPDTTLVLIGLVAYSLFLWSVSWKAQHLTTRKVDEMSVAMPAIVQLGFAMGDRYLAANMGVFRSQTIGTQEFQTDTYAALAKVQLVTAQLNPKHEDNYYTAAAILPWNGQLDIAQTILGYAVVAREKDPLPPFFRGFDKYHFLHDYVGAGQDLLLAADRSESTNAVALRSIASHWIERGYEPAQARNMILAMAKNTNNARLANLLNARAARLEGLIALQVAAKKMQEKMSRPPEKLEELVQFEFISALPQDPFGLGYELDVNGVPQLASRVGKKK